MEPTRLLCPWNFPGKNTGVVAISFSKGIFRAQGSNPCLLNWQANSLPLSHQGSHNNTFLNRMKFFNLERDILENGIPAQFLLGVQMNPIKPVFHGLCSMDCELPAQMRGHCSAAECWPGGPVAWLPRRALLLVLNDTFDSTRCFQAFSCSRINLGPSEMLQVCCQGKDNCVDSWNRMSSFQI